MKIHHLKTWSNCYEYIIHPDPKFRKNIEIRKNDRDFKVGDILVLEEYDNLEKKYTGRKTTRLITYVVGEPWLQENLIGLSLVEISSDNHKTIELSFGESREMLKMIEDCMDRGMVVNTESANKLLETMENEFFNEQRELKNNVSFKISVEVTKK